MITQARLKELLYYSPSTGQFFWNVSRGNQMRRGDRAGTQRADGYWLIRIDGVCYYAHCLAYLYVHGSLPSDVTDHANADCSRNPIANLRPASYAQNQWNARLRRDNTVGLKGVSFYKPNGQYRAQIKRLGRKKHLGYFATPEEAHAAYLAAAQACFGEFARAS